MGLVKTHGASEPTVMPPAAGDLFVKTPSIEVFAAAEWECHPHSPKSWPFKVYGTVKYIFIDPKVVIKSIN